LKVSTEKVEGCQVALTVEIEPEEMEKALDGAYRRLVHKVAIPGFRKGKAPRALLERHMGRESFEAEALERLIPELYDQAIEQEDIAAIAQPSVEMMETDPPIFKATVPVQPVVELGDYHSIRITPETIDITPENVEEGIENLRKLHATLEPVEREAQADDVVVINIKASVDGDTVLDREGDLYRLNLDSDVPVPGFAAEILGMKSGESKEFTLPFPAEHPNEVLAGKDCFFQVDLSEVKLEVLPEVDEDFVKGLGQGLETVEQLREKLSENMSLAAEKNARQKLESEVLDELARISKVEFPDVLTEYEIDRMARDQMMRMGGMQLQDFLRYRGITEEDYSRELRPAAQKRVLTSLVLNKVHDAEEITVSEEEVEAEISRIIEEAGEQGEQMREMFSTGEAHESIRGRLLTEKTLNHLIEIATSGEPDQTADESVPDPGAEEEEQTTEEEQS